MDGSTSWAWANDSVVNQSTNALDNARARDSLGITKRDDDMLKISFFLGLVAAPVAAHELWIEPLKYELEAETKLTAHIVNGQDFAGVQLPFVPRRFVHFVVLSGDKFQKVTSRIGDSPALNQSPVAKGLNIVAYQAHSQTVGYENWEKFQKFLDHKDLGDQLDNHESRGFPLEDFKEVYSRYSKSLVAVGDGAGSDKQIGLETEIVALTNPYTEDLSSGMKVQLYYRKDVRADAQIEVFEKALDDSVNIFLVRTDADGIATVPVKAGHDYMLDAVVLREPAEQLAADTGAAWETLWANMTFMAP